MSVEIVTGDYKLVPFQLYRRVDDVNQTFDMSTASSVLLILRKGLTLVSSQLVCSAGTVGADWANSLVVAEMDPAFTSGISLGNTENESQVQANIQVIINSNPETWIIDEPLTILRGLI